MELVKLISENHHNYHIYLKVSKRTPLQSSIFRKILTKSNLEFVCDFKFSDEFIHVWVNIVEHAKRMINNTAF
jgi:hypothetical protein